MVVTKLSIHMDIREIQHQLSVLKLRLKEIKDESGKKSQIIIPVPTKTMTEEHNDEGSNNHKTHVTREPLLWKEAHGKGNIHLGKRDTAYWEQSTEKSQKRVVQQEGWERLYSGLAPSLVGAECSQLDSAFMAEGKVAANPVHLMAWINNGLHKYGSDPASHPVYDDDLWKQCAGDDMKGGVFGWGSMSYPQYTMTATSTTRYTGAPSTISKDVQNYLDSIRGELKEELKEEMKVELKEEMNNELKEEMREELKEEMREELKEATRAEIQDMLLEYDLHNGISDTFGNHDDLATCIKYSDQTGQVVTGGWDKMIKCWDSRSMKTLSVPISVGVESICLCGLIAMVAVGTFVNIYDLRKFNNSFYSKCVDIQIRCVQPCLDQDAEACLIIQP
ncbi:Nucleic acid-binding, OB-fold [Artemisia annua]|uniref:Nucleic acid-binding, OB-fold n=1 Tax=Artemisia annua TaxID=35608 RepID=A0A2U1LT18_ARTAN|nr:Nucleic acid-binding, OB-fold [Artemisia annua]